MDAFVITANMTIWLVALIACIESLAFAGIVVPGVALLFAVASAAGQQQINLSALLMAAYCGAVVGDQLSYWLGRYAAPALKSRWPLKQHPGWITQGQRFFQNYGSYSVVLGRFVGPVRPVIPFVAGTLGMTPARFTLFNLLSALVWAPAYILPGYLLGSSAAALPAQWLTAVYLLTGLIIVLLLFHKLHQWLQPDQPLTARTAQILRRNCRWPQEQTVPLPALVLLIVCSGAWLAILGLRHIPAIQQLNHATHALLSTALAELPLIAGFTMLGDKPLLILLVLVGTGTLYRKSQSLWPALFCLLIPLSGILTNSALKLLFAVQRPAAGQWLNSYSFPSGHTSAAAICLGAVAVLIALPLSAPLRRAVYLTTLILVSAVALSRVGLGVHWPLDVLAAMALGGVFAASLRIIAGYMNWREQLNSNSSVLLLLLSAITVAGYLSYFWQDNLRLYGIAALSPS